MKQQVKKIAKKLPKKMGPSVKKHLIKDIADESAMMREDKALLKMMKVKKGK